MALLWPFTYIGSSVIVDFYDVANWYVGTLAAGAVYATVASTFLLAALFYEENTAVSSGYIWLETILYVVIETLAWYTSVWEYPKAHRQFYYAYSIDLAEENEASEQQQSPPIGEEEGDSETIEDLIDGIDDDEKSADTGEKPEEEEKEKI